MERPMIYKQMAQVMKDIKSVSKDQKNLAQGFKFRGIDQFVNALYPALTKNGVFLTPRAVKYDQELREVTRTTGKQGVDKHVSIMMEYDFYAEDGSKVTVGPIPAEGLDSGDKATNKALSAALKYALIQTFSIPTEDMAEADSETPEIIPAKRTAATSGLVTNAASTVTTAVTSVSTDSTLKSTTASLPDDNTVHTSANGSGKKSSFRKTASAAPESEWE